MYQPNYQPNYQPAYSPTYPPITYPPMYRLLFPSSVASVAAFFLLTFLLPLLNIPVQAADRTEDRAKDQAENPAVLQDIWRIDTRAAGRWHAGDESFSHLKFFRRQNGIWRQSDAETFLKTQDVNRPLIVFVPGWRSPAGQTTETGLHLVRKFDADKACRVVFWDWLSEPVFLCPRVDIQRKIPVAVYNGEMLNLFVRKLPPKSRVCLFGFSFGCRIIGYACEPLTHDDLPEGTRLHLVLSAAAMDQYGLAAGHRQENLLHIADKIFISYNPQDRALRWYSAVYRGHTRVNALGRTGPPWSMMDSEFRERIEAVNVFPYIGREHRTTAHIDTPAFTSRIGQYFFFE